MFQQHEAVFALRHLLVLVKLLEIGWHRNFHYACSLDLLDACSGCVTLQMRSLWTGFRGSAWALLAITQSSTVK